MKRKLLVWGTIVSLVALVAISLFFGYHFYFIFENSHTLFQIRHNAVRHLEGYSDKWSYYPGDSVSVYVSSSQGGEVSANVFSVVKSDTILKNLTFTAAFQALPDRPSISGANWQVSCRFQVPDSCETGWYALQLKKGSQVYHTSLFIKPRLARKRIAYLFSTNTWNAYNYWGGQSLYTRNYSAVISFSRPQLLADPFLNPSIENLSYAYQSATKDRYLANWLGESGYDFDAYSMTDLQESSAWLKQYDIVLISTHAEYWTPIMIDHLNEFLDEGGSLFSLSGNTAAWVSHFSPSRDSLIVHKQDSQLWIADTTRCRPFGTNTYFLALHTYAPYEALVDTSWVFAGTGLQSGDLFGLESDTYDPTHMYRSEWKNFRNLFKWEAKTMASGMESDRIDRKTPNNWITIAEGLNPPVEGGGEIYPETTYNWIGGGGAQMGYYLHDGGGIVFNVSSVSFTGAIPYDDTIRQIMHNVMEKLMEKKVEK